MSVNKLPQTFNVRITRKVNVRRQLVQRIFVYSRTDNVLKIEMSRRVYREIFPGAD